MSLQNFLNKNQKAVAIIAVGVIGFALYTTMRSSGVIARSAPSMYYYDVTTGETFTAPAGSEGILAYVFACSDCSDASERFVAYIKKYTDDATAEMAKPQPDLQILADGELIAIAGTDPKWVPLNTPAAGNLTNAAYDKCEQPKQCLP